MKIIKIKHIKDDSIFQKMPVVNGVTFLEREQCKEVIDAAKRNCSVIKEWFDKIGIKYDSVTIVASNIVYSVNGEELSLPDLSSGERYLLYLIACKYLHKEVIAQGLFERLGAKLEQVVLKELMDFEELIVVLYNAYPRKEFKQCVVEEL